MKENDDNVKNPCIIPVPYEEGCFWRKGTKMGPESILGVLKDLREYSIDERQLLAWDISSIIEESVAINPYSKAECLDNIYNAALKTWKENKIPIFLGGDHSITYPIIKAYTDLFHRQICIIQFDAHSDTFEAVGGYQYHHGATFKNIVEKANIQGQNIYQFGIRGFVRGDSYKNAEELGINVISMSELDEKGCSLDQFHLPEDMDYYISFDIDSLDPAYAPGTGTPVPGGFTTREIFKCIRQLKKYNIVGIDLVEVAPVYDNQNITSLLAAHIVAKFLAILSKEK